MRLLLTSHPTSSHLAPGLAPLAHVARALGHEVAVDRVPSNVHVADYVPQATQCALLIRPGLEQLVRDLEALPVPRVLTTCQSGDLRP
jgi:hypothetical protein